MNWLLWAFHRHSLITAALEVFCSILHYAMILLSQPIGNLVVMTYSHEFTNEKPVVFTY